ncbi:hypothetical protein [Scytonema hofmannii]|uniref:hypothetical protein n=1 Tax=Scytonema hofmannii TaxID=34078 RepID=UPI00234ED392|nr:hypothetical protein [Scytonema hofmannii]
MTFLTEDSNEIISPQDKAQISTLIEPIFSKNHRDRCYIGLIFQQGKKAGDVTNQCSRQRLFQPSSSKTINW